jgi:hydrogenase maturation protease
MIAVVACGNPNRSDDGAGLAVLQLLKVRTPHQDVGVRLLDAGTDGMAAMFASRGCRTLIIIDACRSGSAPGSIFEVPGSELTQRYEPGLNLHDFRWDHALFAGKSIFRDTFPDDVVVFLIEAQQLDLGLTLSEAVSGAVSKVADRIEELVRIRLSTESRA